MTVSPNQKIIGAAWTSRGERIMSGKRDYDILIKEQQDKFGAGNLDEGTVIRSKMTKLATSIQRDESLQELSYRVMSHAVVDDIYYINRVLVTLGEAGEGKNTFLGASLVVMMYVSQIISGLIRCGCICICGIMGGIIGSLRRHCGGLMSCSVRRRTLRCDGR